MADLDNVLSDHLTSATVFKCTSKTVQNELLDCMFGTYREHMAEEIRKTSFVSVQADETTDVSNMSQFVIILRYVVGDKVQERLYGFEVTTDRSSSGLNELIKRCLENYEVRDKLISQTYDGAATMSGRLNGVQAKIKEMYPNAHFVHCYAQQLNLIMQSACARISELRLFFANLSAFVTFFSQFPKRNDVLREVFDRRMVSSGSTRWNFKSRSVNSVYENREALKECLGKIVSGTGDHWDYKTLNEASGLLRLLEDVTFLYYLEFFHRLMPHVDLLYSSLQKRNIICNEIHQKLRDFTKSVQDLRELIDTIEIHLENNATAKRKERPPAHTCKEACDIVINEAEDRFSKSDHSVVFQLVNPSLFPAHSKIFPESTLDLVAANYPTISPAKLKTELSVIYGRKDFHVAKTTSQLLEFLYENELADTFSETFMLLQICLTTPVSSAESERCFSTLKRIKTFLRNTMTNDRLCTRCTICTKKFGSWDQRVQLESY